MTTILKVTTPEQMAVVVRMRLEVYCAEQGIDMLVEFDGSDEVPAGAPEAATHYLLYGQNQEAMATGRYVLHADGVARIGRMVTLKPFRGQGYGRQVLDFIIEDLKKQGITKTYLSAQLTAADFYKKADFVMSGEPYIQSGLPHVKMTRTL